ncbi:MAG: SIS domain-containing protein [Muribaculaceae bacterium]|nr:SIS domain-containing protein [Muribaculaceae bacterium]
MKRKKSCMECEIFEQSKIAQKILDSYLDKDGKINIKTPADINRIIIVASGSSYHCARYAAELFGSISKIEARAVYSSEFLLNETIAHQEGILYIFITQSGETTDTNRALDKAKEFGVKTLCITNKENSTIWNASEYKLACHAGEEKSIAATKSFTSQLLCSTLLALKFAQDKDIDIYDYVLELKNLPSIIEKTYELHPKIKQLARFISKYKHIIITADGQSYALAKEASLKIKETSYLHTNSSILGEFMHGHVAILNNKNSVLIYILNDNFTYSTIKNLNTIKESYNPPICLIGNRTNQVKSTYNINVECEKPVIKTFAIAVIIQLLALETALKLRKNVDKPHGLNKVVK